MILEATALLRDLSDEPREITNLIKDAVSFNASQVNIELNTHYDPTRDLTEVIIATPDVTPGI